SLERLIFCLKSNICGFFCTAGSSSSGTFLPPVSLLLTGGQSMYCSHCGRQMEDEARFCSACGTARGSAAPSNRVYEVKKLIRPREGRRIAGVCAGVANYFEMDVTLVRILWI